MQNKYLREILEVMCSFVGADLDKIDVNKNNWFWEYEWDKPKEDTFISWLITYMQKNKEARDSLMTFPSKRKRDIKMWAEMFTYNYGWKTKLS